VTLKEVNMGHSIAGYSDILPLHKHIVSSESFTRHELPTVLDDHIEEEFRYLCI
jgi:hypothetical protein